MIVRTASAVPPIVPRAGRGESARVSPAARRRASARAGAASVLVVLTCAMSANSHGQSCESYIPADTPSSDFALLNNFSVVLHTQTGLVWDRCILGKSGAFCDGGIPWSGTWQLALEAMTNANRANYKGFSDWRLPNAHEMRSIIERCHDSPNVNEYAFPNTPSAEHWTGTPARNDVFPAFDRNIIAVDFSGAGQRIVDAQGRAWYVRMVRGGREHFDAYQRVNADFDGDGVSASFNDLQLLIRFMLGYRGDRLTNGLITAAATRTSAQIEAYLAVNANFDVFGRSSTQTTGTQDALIIIRLSQGVPDSALLVGVTPPTDAVHTTAAAIRAYVAAKLGRPFPAN